MRVAVIINQSAGTGAHLGSAGLAELSQAFRDEQIDSELDVVEAKQICRRARRAASRGVDAVIAAGGDGTIRSVAAALAGTDIPLGVLPAGTLNHFARDLGVPLDWSKAIRTFARGRRRRIDVAEVNGELFVNNASVGLYPRIVRRREEQRRDFGRAKFLALALAAVESFNRFPLFTIRVETPERTFVRTTPFLFVGNNVYETALPSLGRRLRMDAGCLSLYLAQCRGRGQLLRLILKTLTNRLSVAEGFEAHTAGEIRLETGRRRLHVALDGEVLRLTPPLLYRTLPGALNVLTGEEGSP